MTDQQARTDSPETPESYPTFWDAIPVDPPAAPPAARYGGSAEDGPAVALYLERGDV